MITVVPPRCNVTVASPGLARPVLQSVHPIAPPYASPRDAVVRPKGIRSVQYNCSMASPRSPRDEIIKIVNGLDDEAARRLLDFLNMRADPDRLSEDEMVVIHEADAAFGRGEYLADTDFKKKYRLP